MTRPRTFLSLDRTDWTWLGLAVLSGAVVGLAVVCIIELCT